MRRVPRVSAGRVLKLIAVGGLLAAVLWVSYGVAAGLGMVGNDDRSRHLAGNEALLRDVPIYPGAAYLGATIYESKEGNGYAEGFGPITSYTTTRHYGLDDAPERPAVVDWYRSHLAEKCEFRHGSGHGDGRYFDGLFRCGTGYIQISPSEDSLSISADYDAYAE
jgi:hypothetical protein